MTRHSKQGCKDKTGSVCGALSHIQCTKNSYLSWHPHRPILPRRPHPRAVRAQPLPGPRCHPSASPELRSTGPAPAHAHTAPFKYPLSWVFSSADMHAIRRVPAREPQICMLKICNLTPTCNDEVCLCCSMVPCSLQTLKQGQNAKTTATSLSCSGTCASHHHLVKPGWKT